MPHRSTERSLPNLKSGRQCRALAEALESRRLLSAGDLDPTFGRGGSVYMPEDLEVPYGDTPSLTVLSNGNSIALHTGNAGALIVRRKPNGAQDRTFGQNGIVVPVLPAALAAGSVDFSQMVVDGQGRLVLLGSTGGQALVARYTSSGALDTTFGGGNGAVFVPLDESVAVDSAGRILVGGVSIGDTEIERLKTDGTPDATFGTGGLVALPISGVTQIVSRSDGSLILREDPVSNYETVATQSQSETLLALTAAGQVDSTFGNAGKQTISVAGPLALAPGGKIVVAGSALIPQDPNPELGNYPRSDCAVVRLTGNGQIDSTFGTGGIVRTSMFPEPNNTQVQASSTWGALQVLPDGSIITAGTGSFNTDDGYSAVLAGRYLPNGAFDPSFNGGAIYYRTTFRYVRNDASSVAAVAGGKILFGGQLEPDVFLLQLKSDGTEDPAYGHQGLVQGQYPGEDTPFTFARDLPDGSILAVDGSTIHLNADGSLDEADYFTPKSAVADHAASVPGGKTIIGGDHYQFPTPGHTFDLERLLPNRTLDPTFGVGGKVSLDLNGALSYIRGGTFTTAPDGSIIIAEQTNDTDGILLTRLTPSGQLDSTFGGSGRQLVPSGLLNNSIQQMLVDTTGRIILLTRAYEQTPVSITRFLPNGQLDPAFGNGGVVRNPLGANISVDSITVTAEGRIVAAGSDTAQQAIYVSALTATSGAVNPSFGVNGQTIVPVRAASAGAMTVENNGDIVVAGNAGSGMGAALFAARITPTGRLDSAFGAGGVAQYPFDGVGVDWVSTDAQGRLIVAGSRSTRDGSGFDTRVGAALFRILSESTGGAVSGTIFNDGNQNGARDAGEAGLPGWTVYVDLNNDAKFEPGEPSGVSAADGTYRIVNLAPGTYHLRDERAAGWTATQPAGGASGGLNITIVSGQTTSAQDFGNFKSVSTPAPSPTPTPTPTPGPTPTPTATGPLTATVTASLPASVIAGAKVKGSAVVVVKNNQAQSVFNGPVTIKLLFSTDAQADASDATAETLVKKLKLKAGQSKSLKVKFNKVPASLADGTYNLLATVTTGGAVSDVAVASSSVAVAAPLTDLAISVPSTAPLTVAPGAKVTETVALQNVGNVFASGSAVITFTATGGATAQTLETAHVKVRLAPDRSKSYRVKFTVPQDLPAGSYTLAANLDDTTLGDNLAGNNTAQAAGTFTVT